MIRLSRIIIELLQDVRLELIKDARLNKLCDQDVSSHADTASYCHVLSVFSNILLIPLRC